MQNDPVGTVCDEIGEAPILAATAAFYRRVSQDDLLRPMYPAEDLAGAEQRLADFLVGRFGGSDRYVQKRGHPRLRMRHAGFKIDKAARDRWMQLMSEALLEVDFPQPQRSRVAPFLEDVATFLINQ